MALADDANAWIAEVQPWVVAKQEGQEQHLQALCSTALNLFRTLVIYLQPVVPTLAGSAADFLKVSEFTWDDAQTRLTAHTIGKFKPLMQRVEMDAVNAMIEAGKQVTAPAPAETEQIQRPNAPSMTSPKSICELLGLTSVNRSRAKSS